jgi:pimeloyl-ACP methyl ester carboxylesterase
VSWSGCAYLLGVLVVLIGLVARKRRRPGVTRVGLALVAATACIRTCTGARGETMTMTTTDGRGARALGRLVDEGDVATLGARVLVAGGFLHDPDAPEVPGALARAYSEMREAEGDAPSPLVPTYAGLERPDAADVIVVRPPRGARGALIFLHGFAGSFALPCWQIAQAASDAGYATYCPSVGWRGDWWSNEGERTLRKTVELARADGHTRIFLAGLSNGGVGASWLAPRMRGTFRGVILVSGASPDAPPCGVRALVLHGASDAMASASAARAWAKDNDARYVGLRGGHFALLLHRHDARAAIARFLNE